MNSPTRVEFYHRGGKLLTTIFSNTVPREGEYVNIEKKQYRIAYVSWAIDINPNEFRANVELIKVPDNEVGPSGVKRDE